MFKFLYDIIAIKKGHFGCLPVALPGSKASLAYARNSLASDPSPFRRCSAFHTSTPSPHLYLAADMSGKVVVWTGLNNVCACAQLWRAKIGHDNNLIENGGYFKIL